MPAAADCNYHENHPNSRIITHLLQFRFRNTEATHKYFSIFFFFLIFNGARFDEHMWVCVCMRGVVRWYATLSFYWSLLPKSVHTQARCLISKIMMFNSMKCSYWCRYISECVYVANSWDKKPNFIAILISSNFIICLYDFISIVNDNNAIIYFFLSIKSAYFWVHLWFVCYVAKWRTTTQSTDCAIILCFASLPVMWFFVFSFFFSISKTHIFFTYVEKWK